MMLLSIGGGLKIDWCYIIEQIILYLFLVSTALSFLR